MKFAPLPTAAIADACVRLKVPARAVTGLYALMPGRIIAGPVLPVQHAGSVDVFFEALQSAKPGTVLCIDNGGRLDEGCIGDLTTLEAMHHGCVAILLDGAHRDTTPLRQLGLPVWSRGRCPFGPMAARPRAPDALQAATLGGHRVTADDVVVLDEDGAVFVPAAQAAKVWDLAKRIQTAELEQVRLAKAGTPMCEQFQVPAFLAARRKDPALGFRAHLRAIGKAIEE
ncbi:MAG: RraA family protein [Candidatus Thermoplasmatota archaeon]